MSEREFIDNCTLDSWESVGLTYVQGGGPRGIPNFLLSG